MIWAHAHRSSVLHALPGKRVADLDDPTQVGACGQAFTWHIRYHLPARSSRPAPHPLVACKECLATLAKKKDRHP